MSLGETNMSKFKIYKDLDFHKWQKKTALKNSQLIAAIMEVEDGLYDAKLGNLYKKRIAKPGMGKSGGYRTIIACKVGVAWFYIYGFGKDEMDNISNKQKEALDSYVNKTLFPDINLLIQSGDLIEVKENE